MPRQCPAAASAIVGRGPVKPVLSAAMAAC